MRKKGSEASSTLPIPDSEGREARRLRREQESAAWKAESNAAREIVNALSAKYGVADVFLSDTTPELMATEMANMVADALTSDPPRYIFSTNPDRREKNS